MNENLPNNSTPSTSTPVKENCSNCIRGGMPMKKELLSFVVVILIAMTTFLGVMLVNEKRQNATTYEVIDQELVTESLVNTQEIPVKIMDQIIDLPEPNTKGGLSLEETLNTRRSRRTFADEPVSLEELSQIVWSAQGITDENGHRTAPSAKSAYPFTIYLVVRNVEGLESGLYQYLPENHQLGALGIANAGEMLSSAGVQQGAQDAPVVMMLSASYGKMLAVFPENDPVPNTMLEAGHIGQNVYLQVEALGMSGVVMGGFDSAKVVQALNLNEAEDVVYLIPVGHRSIQEEAAH